MKGLVGLSKINFSQIKRCGIDRQFGVAIAFPSLLHTLGRETFCFHFRPLIS